MEAYKGEMRVIAIFRRDKVTLVARPDGRFRHAQRLRAEMPVVSVDSQNSQLVSRDKIRL